MPFIASLFIVVLLSACTSQPPYAWQDTRQPAREDATADLEHCRAYAAQQYRPGMPAGAPYLRQRETAIGEDRGYTQGVWRPDRAPFPTTNVNALPTHDVPVGYTGYPGELDYSPGYLDAILEKCMNDRGWAYDALMEIKQ